MLKVLQPLVAVLERVSLHWTRVPYQMALELDPPLEYARCGSYQDSCIALAAALVAYSEKCPLGVEQERDTGHLTVTLAPVHL